MTKLFKGLIAALLTMALTYAPLASAQSITYSPNTLPLSGSCGTVTLNTPCLNLTQTWNAGGVTFTGALLNVTDTASAAGSLLLDLQVGGSTKFNVNKQGGFFANSGSTMNGNTLSDIGTLRWGTGTNDVRLERDAAAILALRNGTNGQTVRIYETYTDASNGSWLSIGAANGRFEIAALANGTGTQRSLHFVTGAGNGNTRWNITSSGDFYASTDNTYDIGASGANRPRNLYIAGQGTFGGTVLGSQLQTSAGLVSGLGTATAGRRGMVTDATVAATGNFGAIVAGGGANTVPVWADGTNWRIG